MSAPRRVATRIVRQRRGLFTARTRGACPPLAPPAPPAPPALRRPRSPAAAAPHRWRVWELAGSQRSHDIAPSAPYISPRQSEQPHSAFNAQR
ncbi:unnamed protein product [Leptidea sinapis]|uniref:Uncharacterized protein n=1 Tax=Leptidea sinapis TaxID=189913 RepID=A0A5E4PVE0_9NEOP|nr:unnamed protein product [Leptidea sinapis]